MKTTQLNLLKIVALSVLISACATMVPPTGGPMDKQPPEVVECEPPNGSVNFEPQRVKITFNEFVKLSDVQNQVLISPPVKDKPVFSMRGKSLIFDVPDSLRQNTTYSIFFGNSIADITEGNEMLNYKYSFSTGSYLDSLFLSGHAHQALTHETEAGWIIMLYKEYYDSIPMKEAPFYLTKTDEQGYFRFENLAPGNYKIFGLNDQNKNYLYDQPAELIAFSDSLVQPFQPVTLPDSILNDSLLRDSVNLDSIRMAREPHGIHLTFFNELDSIQVLKESNVINEFIYELKFRFPAKKLLIKSPQNNSFTTRYDELRESVNLYFPTAVEDSLQLILNDTAWQWTDTIWLEPAKAKRKKNQITTNATSGVIPHFQHISFRSEIPFSTINQDKISLIEKQDSIADTLVVDFSFADSIKRTEVVANVEWNLEKKYQITALPEAFELLNGNTNDTITSDFSIKLPENYGNIIFELENTRPGMNYIIQLTSKDKKKIVKQIRFPEGQSIRFDHLTPETYYIRVIEDKNNNGLWDTGVYIEGRQPEASWFFHKEFSVRANWEVKESMNLKMAH